ncbi:hypothetical protein HYC85_006709 [Camellia sinensis]|uniref:Uncharacterized protein n=1 Tax=Camellia sinensis TaxID=4442 RepID=A0A7J7HLW5_CAMSI|nr:hypothetical protein HYC85_006709 [Camellia sinensis]
MKTPSSSSSSSSSSSLKSTAFTLPTEIEEQQSYNWWIQPSTITKICKIIYTSSSVIQD